MTLPEAIEILEYYNKWRKNRSGFMIKPESLTKAIDCVVKELKKERQVKQTPTELDIKKILDEKYECFILIASEKEFEDSDIGSATEKLHIATSGNVGIGTNAPQNKLDVEGGEKLIAYCQKCGKQVA